MTFPVDSLAIGATRREVEAWCEKVIWPILMSAIQDSISDLVGREGAEVIGAEECSETSCVPWSVY